MAEEPAGDRWVGVVLGGFPFVFAVVALQYFLFSFVPLLLFFLLAWLSWLRFPSRIRVATEESCGGNRQRDNGQ